MNRNLILADDFDAPDEPFKPALPHEPRIRVNSVKTLTRCYVCVTDEYEFLRSRCPRSTLTTRICACIGGGISHIVMIYGSLFKAVQIAGISGRMGTVGSDVFQYHRNYAARLQLVTLASIE